jgi:hypothetical protein
MVPEGHHFHVHTHHSLAVNCRLSTKKIDRASRAFCDIPTMAVSFSTVKAILHT